MAKSVPIRSLEAREKSAGCVLHDRQGWSGSRRKANSGLAERIPISLLSLLAAGCRCRGTAANIQHWSYSQFLVSPAHVHPASSTRGCKQLKLVQLQLHFDCRRVRFRTSQGFNIYSASHSTTYETVC